jgi:hypothetical protein
MASDHFADRFVVRFRWGDLGVRPPLQRVLVPRLGAGGCCSSSRARSASSRLSWPRTSTAPVSSAVTVLRRSDSAGPLPAGQVRPLGLGQPHRAAQSGRPRPAEGPRRRGRGGPRPHGRQAQRQERAHTGDKPGQCPDRDRARCVAVAGRVRAASRRSHVRALGYFIGGCRQQIRAFFGIRCHISHRPERWIVKMARFVSCVRPAATGDAMIVVSQREA